MQLQGRRTKPQFSINEVLSKVKQAAGALGGIAAADVTVAAGAEAAA